MKNLHRSGCLATIAALTFVLAAGVHAEDAKPAMSGPLIPKPGAPNPTAFTLPDRYLDAAQRGDLAMLTRCLDKGVDVHAKDSVGRSALLLAARESRKLEVVKFLHERGLAVDEADATGRSALADAAGNGDTEIVSWLLGKGAAVTRKDAQGRTPLYGAAMSGSAETVRKLLEAGAEVNVRDNYGDTPLIDACDKGHDDVARLLVEKGADPSLRDQESRTARERAAETATYCRSLPDTSPPH